MATTSIIKPQRAAKRGREEDAAETDSNVGRFSDAPCKRKQPTVCFSGSTKTWDGLCKSSAVVHDVFIDLLRSGVSVCPAPMLRAVAEQRSVGLDSQGIAVVAHRIADLILRLEQSALDAAAPVPLPADPKEEPSTPAAKEPRRRASLTEEDDDLASGSPDADDESDSEVSLTSEETAETDDDAQASASSSSSSSSSVSPAAEAATATPPSAARYPVPRMQTVPVLPRGGGLALKVGPPALPLLRLLLHQVVEIHATRSAWEAQPAAAKRAHLAGMGPTFGTA